MRGHVDAESLALCAEGLLSRRRSERIRSHVASCAECAATQARLTEVPALLARVPPPPLPPGIAARLDAALSAEVARRGAQQPGTVPHAEPAQHLDTIPPPRPGRPPAPRPRGPRLRLPVMGRVLATAGVLVVAGGVGYAVSQSSSTSSGSSSSGSASAGSAASPISTARAGPQVRTPVSGSASAAAGGGAGLTVRHSGTRYHKDTFAAEAAAVLKKPTAGLNRPGKGTGGLAPQAPQAPSPALTGCLDEVAGLGAVRAGEVKLVDQARYQGHPATIIVVQATPAQPGTVYVAGARCSAAHADILARAPLRASG